MALSGPLRTETSPSFRSVGIGAHALWCKCRICMATDHGKDQWSNDYKFRPPSPSLGGWMQRPFALLCESSSFAVTMIRGLQNPFKLPPSQSVRPSGRTRTRSAGMRCEGIIPSFLPSFPERKYHFSGFATCKSRGREREKVKRTLI